MLVVLSIAASLLIAVAMAWLGVMAGREQEARRAGMTPAERAADAAAQGLWDQNW